MNYDLVILSIEEITNYFYANINKISAVYNYGSYYHEDIFDWVVLQALNDILRNDNNQVKDHIKHDFYMSIYDDLGVYIKFTLSNKLDTYKLNFKNKTVKAMVLGNKLIIAKN